MEVANIASTNRLPALLTNSSALQRNDLRRPPRNTLLQNSKFLEIQEAFEILIQPAGAKMPSRIRKLERAKRHPTTPKQCFEVATMTRQSDYWWESHFQRVFSFNK